MFDRGSLLEREKEIFRILNLLLDEKLDFVIVGGYAVSTYKKRFSVDLDLVIDEKDFGKFKKLLIKNKYFLSYDKEIGTLYGEKFVRFAKKIRNLDVSVDLLINGLVSRKTNASWSFKFIKKHSEKRKLESLRFLIPKKELLIAMKFHAGRLSDVRDIVALMPCNVKEVKKFLFNGNLEILKKLMKECEEFLRKEQFDDSFKGIFGVHVYKKEDVEEVRKLIMELGREKWLRD